LNASETQKHRAPGGRPTRDEAERRNAELLDAALEAFLDRGYEQATIDAISLTVGMAKRTIYARYPDKAALFRAAVQRAIERFVVPREDLEALITDELEETLLALARVRTAHVLSPIGLRLQRILSTESYRFPEIFEASVKQGTLPMIEVVTDVLARHGATGAAMIEDPKRAATLFLNMVLAGPMRIFTAGHTIPPDELNERLEYAVRIFVRGVLARTD